MSRPNTEALINEPIFGRRKSPEEQWRDLERRRKCATLEQIGALANDKAEAATSRVLKNTSRTIIGLFTVAELPSGFAPYEVKKDWIGVQVPIIRTPSVDGHFKLRNDTLVCFETETAIASLFLAGKQQSANYWAALRFRNPVLARLTFDKNEGNIQKLSEPISPKWNFLKSSIDSSE